MIGIPEVPTRVALGRHLRALAMGAAALLVVFHAWLLVERLRDASIAEPAVVLRWTLAGLILGLAAVLRRQGIPIVTGRTGLALWLLVLLLHAGVLPPAEASAPALGAALPLGVATALAALLGAAAVERRVAAARPEGPRPPRLPATPRPGRAVPALARRFFPRPPPEPVPG